MALIRVPCYLQLSLAAMLLLQLPRVAVGYSNRIPNVVSVCNKFSTSHGLLRTTKTARVELWTTNNEKATCYESRASYKVKLVSPNWVKGFLIGTSGGHFQKAHLLAAEAPYATLAKCNDKPIGSMVSHKKIVPKNTDISFSFMAPSGQSPLLFRSVVTFSYKENLENMSYTVPHCLLTPAPTLPTTEPTLNETVNNTSLNSSRVDLNSSIVPSPSPPAALETCKCSRKVCPQTEYFYNDTRNFTKDGKSYFCTSKKALRGVTCTPQCEMTCTGVDCLNTKVPVTCNQTSVLRSKKFNCLERDSNGFITSQAPKQIRIQVTIHPACSCR